MDRSKERFGRAFVVHGRDNLVNQDIGMWAENVSTQQLAGLSVSDEFEQPFRFTDGLSPT